MYEKHLGIISKLRELLRELRRREAEGGIPARQAVREIALLHRARGISPMYYLLAGLYRREVTWGEKLEYLGPERQKAFLNTINPPIRQYLVRNKLVFHGVMTTFGIPTPPFYGVVGGTSGYSHTAHTLNSPSDLLAVMAGQDVDTVCFKHVSGTRGRGFYKVAIRDDGGRATATILPAGEELPIDTLWERLAGASLFDGYFCQGVVDQHPTVARLNPQSLNTARCWMVQGDDGAWSPYSAVLRIGRGQTSVDNFAAGAIGAPIDIETGMLGVAIDKTVERPRFHDHPVTGVRIAGQTLPMWDEAVRLCVRAAERFPYRLVAVDVGFAVDSPLLMEMGATPDDHQIVAGRGVAPMLEHLRSRGGG